MSGLLDDIQQKIKQIRRMAVQQPVTKPPVTRGMASHSAKTAERDGTKMDFHTSTYEDKEITIIGAGRPAAKDPVRPIVETPEVVEVAEPVETLATASTPDTAPARVEEHASDEFESGAQDNYLLSQIDEFRAKAKQLQDLFNSKEAKAKELQKIVSEREDKAQELQQVIDERAEVAKGITEEVAKQINALFDRVDDRLDEMDHTMEIRHRAVQEADARRAEELERTLSDMSRQIDQVQQMSGNLEGVKQLSEEVGNAKSEIFEEVEKVRTELFDKIHYENVQSYRNTQELIRGIDERLSSVEVIEKKVKATKTLEIVTLVLSVIEMAGVGVMLAKILGLF